MEAVQGYTYSQGKHLEWKICLCNRNRDILTVEAEVLDGSCACKTEAGLYLQSRKKSEMGPLLVKYWQGWTYSRGRSLQWKLCS